jgi:bilirubin oxidase
VVANFAPWSGVYMFHCHNLVHEDHDMMAAFNVSQVDLSTFGYPEKVSFNDPMASLFRAKSYSSTDIGQIHDVLLPYFQNLDAYPDAALIEKALDDYYEHPPSSSAPSVSAAPSTLVTTTKSSSASITAAPSTSTEDKPKTTASTSTCSKGGKGKSTC